MGKEALKYRDMRILTRGLAVYINFPREIISTAQLGQCLSFSISTSGTKYFSAQTTTPHPKPFRLRIQLAEMQPHLCT